MRKVKNVLGTQVFQWPQQRSLNSLLLAVAGLQMPELRAGCSLGSKPLSLSTFHGSGAHGRRDGVTGPQGHSRTLCPKS